MRRTDTSGILREKTLCAPGAEWAAVTRMQPLSARVVRRSEPEHGECGKGDCAEGRLGAAAMAGRPLHRSVNRPDLILILLRHVL